MSIGIIWSVLMPIDAGFLCSVVFWWICLKSWSDLLFLLIVITLNVGI